MKNPRKYNVTVTITNESLESFFKRGQDTASLLDQKKPVAPRRIISFADKRDLIAFLNQNKFKLVATVRKRPETVSKLAELLKRSRAAVDKDVKELESIGIIKTEFQVNPGHGRCKIVKAIDDYPVQLQVQTSI